MPVLFKGITRIEVSLFLYFIAMIIQALIERDVRTAIEKSGIKNIPLIFQGKGMLSPNMLLKYNCHFSKTNRPQIIKELSEEAYDREIFILDSRKSITDFINNLRREHERMNF
ncbi:MAG: hypothetical protein ACYCSO_00825 [Cuniculiplasma sp.]